MTILKDRKYASYLDVTCIPIDMHLLCTMKYGTKWDWFYTWDGTTSAIRNVQKCLAIEECSEWVGRWGAARAPHFIHESNAWSSRDSLTLLNVK
ncbi:hypothetical protein RJ639_002736, partial [Escallonia herrerae]